MYLILCENQHAKHTKARGSGGMPQLKNKLLRWNLGATSGKAAFQTSARKVG